MHKKSLTKPEFKNILYRRRYAIPNAVTVGNMFCGFLAIIYSATDRFEKAVVAILIAILLDGLDGRVARKLNATSRFGLEFDSFSDLVSFGVAPALMVYFWCFQKTADEFGVLVCFIYAVCAASRLARFNISAENLSGFTGMPSPAAAGMVVALVNLSPHQLEASYLMVVFGALYVVFAGYLMVSTVEYFSIKKLKLTNIPFQNLLIAASVIALIWYNNRVGLFVLVAAYAVSGPWRHFLQRNVNSAGCAVECAPTKVVESVEPPPQHH